MREALLAALQFPDHDFSWLAQFFSLWVLPFAHEDLAIILGGYIVVNKIMPVGLVALSIYGGMVTSDFALYAVGAGARRLPWLTRFAVDDRVGSFAETLKRNLFGLVALCRVVPGAVFVAFIACGWSRVPLGRFTVASLVVSAIYLPLMLYLVIVSGDALDDRVGLWAWPLLLTVTVALGFVRWRIFTFQHAAKQAGSGADGARARVNNVGTPSDRARKTTRAERIPPLLFYLPLIASWIRFAWRHRSLTLPTVVNPHMPTGGMWGESRSAPLLDIAPNERRWVAEFVVLRRSGGPRTLCADLERARQMLRDAQLTFPLIAKPDVGWCGHGARRIDDLASLREYLRDFSDEALVLQKFAPYTGDAAVLYARLPGAERGRILSLTVGHDPSEPIAALSAGRVYRDANRSITPELEARFDAIAKSMTEFHYGRFDLRFASVEQLMWGEEFSIVGIDGFGAESLDARDPLVPIGEAYRRLIDRQRIQFLIGEKNRSRGFAPMRCAEFIGCLIRRTSLLRRYPASI